MKTLSDIKNRTIRIRRLVSINEIDAHQWDRLCGLANAGMLTSHAFLKAFENSGSVSPATGWAPSHLVLEQDDQIIAAVVLYEKKHSYGEFVFDWAWAEAYERYGMRYYPKWLSAIPFTPVSGPRILCAPENLPLAAGVLSQLADKAPVSSLHVLFLTEAEKDVLVKEDFVIREQIQFHWHNQGWDSFDDYLSSLSRNKRKKIAAERKKVSQAGITTRVLCGADITEKDWEFFYTCYGNTYYVRGRVPYLKQQFFMEVAQTLTNNCMMVIAEHDSTPIACALSWLDTIGHEKRLYGRYWGCIRELDCLHFEVAYYAAIEWAIKHGIQVFEGGAQGEHKLARGFLPVRTYSAHRLQHPGFHDAINRYVREESQLLQEYASELRSPFKNSPQET